MSKSIMIIDGNSLMYRAFYSMTPYPNEKGEYTNAVLGFMNMLLKAIGDFEPSHIVVAFDVQGKTFRHNIFKKYKDGRKPTPPELNPQYPILMKILASMNIKTVEAPNYEADDILGTLAKKADEINLPAFLVTGDKDILQLISDNTMVLLTKKGLSEIIRYDKQMLKEVYSLEPWQIPELKGLMGDNSDNIPGIKGVGEKTAIKLLAEYNNIDELYKNTDKLKGKLQEKVIADEEAARMSRELATITREVPIETDILNYTCKPFEETKLIETLDEYGFRRLATRIRNLTGQVAISNIKIPKAIECKSDDDINKMIVELGKSKTIAMHLDENFHVSDGINEYKISLVMDLFGSGFELMDILGRLGEILSSEKELIVYDKKKWLKLLKEANLMDIKINFDTQIAAYVLSKSTRGGYDGILMSTLNTSHNGAPAYLMIELKKTQDKMISKRNLYKLFYDMEMPLSDVINDMENVGFMIDEKVLKDMDKDFSQTIEEIKAEIYKFSGVEFNISSPKQLGEVLFETLGLSVIKKTKRGYSTDAFVLERLHDEHEIIPLIEKYRHITKLKGTYIDGMIPLIDKQTNRIHTKLNQMGATTGRLSSTAPNLQNIPIRTQQGREIRKAFIASSDNHILVAADYSQIELRVLAHIANDENMLNAFKNNVDIHRQTASQVFNIDFNDITKEQRSSAKAVNFGIVYGISDFGLAKQLNIKRQTAQEFIDKYLAAFPNIKKYMDSTIESGKEKGYVETICGRRIYIPELRATNYQRRSGAQRLAMNAPIQGSAADIIKLAMIEVYNNLKYNKCKSKMILQVHDELIVDTLLGEKDMIMTILKESMENIIQLNCPVIADISEGINWFEAK